jgi:heme A synthase
MRWLEWGTRSYENFTLGLAVLLFAIAMVRTARVPTPIPCLMALSALVYWVQGWAAGTQGFSQTQSTGIVLAEVLNAAWMVWLLVVARRMPDPELASPAR